MKNIVEFLFKCNDNKTMCVDDQSQFTYLEAKEEVKKIACFFANKGIKNKPIMVKAERNCKTLLSILGIALSNNYFVPVNGAYADDKIQSIVDSSNIEYELCFDNNKSSNVTNFDYEEVVKTPVDEKTIEVLKNDFNENNKLYTIYTSGSTGKPKGVLKTQKNAIAFIENFLETFNFEKDLRIANQAPLFFDASMKDILLALATSSTIYFPDKSLFALPLKLVEYLNENKINYICWVPSALTIIVRLKTFNYLKPKFLKYVFFVGEVFMPKYLNIWLKELPDAVYVNLYGSTEIAGICLYKFIEGQLDEEKAIPLGKPLANNVVYLIDGEICVESDQIAIGYVNDPEKNDQVFEIKDNTKILKTGDYAFINDDGDIVFSTRKDFQIKHMGYRIELQEIELSVVALSYVGNCAVLFDAEADKIVAFVTFNQQIDNELKTIINDLKAKLPPYMVPNKIKIMDELPLNFNGKIDRTKLKQMIKE